jgi:hypothetical protein
VDVPVPAVDQHGQVIDVLLSQRRDLAAARRFFTRALRTGTVPAEVTTDRAPAYPRDLDELIPSALHTVERYANNPVEADHGRLKARLRPMRGIKRHRSARILAAGHAFVQNIRRGHYELAADVPAPPPDPRSVRPARPDHLIQAHISRAQPCHPYRSANATLLAQSVENSSVRSRLHSARMRSVIDLANIIDKTITLNQRWSALVRLRDDATSNGGGLRYGAPA